MNFEGEPPVKITEIENFSEAEALLSYYSLPASDLKSNDQIQLYGIYHNDNLVACIGIEIYKKNGLLRSLAIKSHYKKQGLGKRLVEFIEDLCRQNGIREIYLLTESAENYFTKLGFIVSDRRSAPARIKTSTQFSSLCPASATFMHKIL